MAIKRTTKNTAVRSKNLQLYTLTDNKIAKTKPTIKGQLSRHFYKLLHKHCRLTLSYYFLNRHHLSPDNSGISPVSFQKFTFIYHWKLFKATSYTRKIRDSVSKFMIKWLFAKTRWPLTSRTNFISMPSRSALSQCQPGDCFNETGEKMSTERTFMGLLGHLY